MGGTVPSPELARKLMTWTDEEFEAYRASVRAYVSRLWAQDWDCDEDQAYDRH
jgi:hypothetical protein